MLEVPDYLQDEKSVGITGLDQSDFIIPRIKLLQAQSPECQGKDSLRPGVFYHDGTKTVIGDDFTFIPAIASKKAYLWRPSKTGTGEMLAMSRDAKEWATGGNKKFKVTLKDEKTEVIWDTKKSVIQSGLLNWGSSNPEDEKSQPAATLIYEYCCYLVDHPDLSPSMFGTYKTSLNEAKQLNTALLMTRKPIQAIKVKVTVGEMHEGTAHWFIPKFELAGYASKDEYEICKELGNKYAAYTADYQDVNKIEDVIDDKINF
jgi:hypothetical protein